MPRLILATGLIAVAALVGACSGAAAAPSTSDTPGPASTSVPGPTGNTVEIVASDMRFTTTDVVVAAGSPVTIEFDNRDGAPHNVALSDSSGASVFKGEIVSAARVTYSVPALAAGRYPFICEVHPDMKGTITAQ